MGARIFPANGVGAVGRETTWPAKLGGIRTLVIVCLLVGSTASEGFGQSASPRQESSAPRQAQPAPPQNPLEPRTDSREPTDYRAILRRLATADFATRKLLTRQLWLERAESRSVLQAATQDPDPEVAARAKWVLRQWQLGILPGASPRVASLLASGDADNLMQTLLELGEFETVASSLRESRNQKNAQLESIRASAFVRNFFPLYVARASREGTLDDLLAVLDQIADHRELCLTRIEMMMRLSIPITEENLLPESAIRWPPHQVRSWSTMLWTVLGQIDKAIKVADSDPKLLHQVALATGDARALCDSVATKPAPPDADASDPSGRLSADEFSRRSEQLAIALVATDWIPDPKERSEQVDRLMGDLAWGDSWAGAGNPWLACSLTQIGAIDQAAQRLADEDPITAASFLNHAMRYQDAFSTLDQGGDPIDSRQILEAVDSYVVPALQPDALNLQGVDHRLRLWLMWMEIQFSVGNDAEGWAVASRIWQSLSREDLDEKNIEPYESIRGQVLEAIQRTTRDDLILRLLFQDRQEISSEELRLIVKQIDDCDDSAFTGVLGGVTELFRGKSLAIRAAATRDLFEGRIPEGFRSPGDFSRLIQAMRTPSRRQRAAGLRLRGDSNLQIVRMLHKHGQNALAESYLNQMRSDGDHQATWILADRALRSGSADVAWKHFRHIADLGSSQSNSRTVPLPDVLRAEVGAAVSLQQSGLDDRADEAWETIRWMTISPLLYIRTSLADELESTDHQQAIAAALRRSAVMACFEDDHSDLYFVAAALDSLQKSHSLDEASRAELADAAAWWYPIGMLGNSTFRPEWWPAFAHRSAESRLEAAMLRKDQAMASRMIDRLLAVRPLDILLAETTVERLRELGWNELADQTLGRVLQHGDAHLNRYPLDAAVGNNLAWVAAASDASLDSALRWSRMAVDREPQSVIYRDTLAEVLYRLGRVDEAIIVERDCLIDDPGQWHLHKQIRRFESGE